MAYSHSVAFDDLTDGELSEAEVRIAGAALRAARLVAAERLAPMLGPAAADPATTVEILITRDPDDERFDLLRGFEHRWAVLVVRLLERVTNPAAAIRDARSRGVTVAEIADALGIAHQTVYARYGDQITRRRKKPGPDD
jgi:hypothetical protein